MLHHVIYLFSIFFISVQYCTNVERFLFVWVISKEKCWSDDLTDSSTHLPFHFVPSSYVIQVCYTGIFYGIPEVFYRYFDVNMKIPLALLRWVFPLCPNTQKTCNTLRITIIEHHPICKNLRTNKTNSQSKQEHNQTADEITVKV